MPPVLTPASIADLGGGGAVSSVDSRTGAVTLADLYAALAGNQTIAGVKTFSSDPLIPDEAYDATAWNGSLEPPTKNALRDKIETLGAGGSPTIDTLSVFNAFYGSSPTTYDYEFDATTSSLPSGWAWTNQGTATYAERGILSTGVMIVPSSTLNYRIIDRALPSESTWTAIAKMRMAKSRTDYNGAGVVLREATSGEFIVFLLDNVGAIGGQSWNSPTSINAGVGTGQSVNHPDNDLYLKVKRNSATSYDFAWSPDGVVWQQVITAYNPSGFLTIDRIGFGVENRSSIDVEVGIDWFRVRS